MPGERGGQAAGDMVQVKLRLAAVEKRLAEGDEARDAEIAKLQATLDKVLDAYNQAPPPFHLDDLEDEERSQRETELCDWVTDVLQVYHPQTGELLTRTPCWWEHLDARQAVAAAWLAWLGAYRAPGRRRSDPADWIGRHLPALDKQLRAALGERRGCETHPRAAKETS